MSLSWTPFLNEFFSCLLLALLFSCHSLAHVSSLLLGNAHFTRCGSALLSFITSFWISSFFALSSTILFHRCHFLRHHPIWPCLPKLLASVGAVFAPRRRCASARSSTCCATSPRASHTLLSPELVCSGSSLLSKQLQHCLSHTRRLFRFSLLFQLHFAVVYSAVLADSTSGTSDTTAWSSVHGRCSRFTVEVLYNNVVCCLSPLSFWSLGLYHNVVPEVFNTTSVVVVRGKTSCVPISFFSCFAEAISVSLVHAGVPTSLNSAIASLGPSVKASLTGLAAEPPPCRAASAECGKPTSAECMLFCLVCPGLHVPPARLSLSCCRVTATDWNSHWVLGLIGHQLTFFWMIGFSPQLNIVTWSSLVQSLMMHLHTDTFPVYGLDPCA